jgi:hypothetical protein
MAYDNHIQNSHNKIKGTWKIINTETGKFIKRDHTQYLIDKYKDKNVAEILNNYFFINS